MHRPSFDMHREHRGIAAPGIAVSAEQRTFIPVPGWCTHTGVRQTKGREAGSTGAMLLLQRGRFGAARAVRQALETPSSLSYAAVGGVQPHMMQKNTEHPRPRGVHHDAGEPEKITPWCRSVVRYVGGLARPSAFSHTVMVGGLYERFIPYPAALAQAGRDTTVCCQPTYSQLHRCTFVCAGPLSEAHALDINPKRSVGAFPSMAH
jgi:hypothetical protein